jgi:Arc/MetJ-type ribon-helix-helix transcriptional regulator
MVKMISFQVEDEMADLIQKSVSLGLFSSRSEFLKEAVRLELDRQRERNEWRKQFDKVAKEMKVLAKKRGYDGRMPTRKERAKIADEWVKENYPNL